MFHSRIALGIAALLSFATAVRGEESQPPSYECRWASTSPRIDGIDDDPVWRSAAAVSEFGQAWRSDKPAIDKQALRTRAKLLWDASHLYFFAELDDADLFADLKEHDSPTWQNDVFELFFKPGAKHAGYYEFQVNAAGTRMEMFLPERDKQAFAKFAKRDPFAWETAVVRRGTLENRNDQDGGWSVEGRIPWSDLAHTGGRPAVDETWTFALCRYDYDKADKEPTISSSAPLKEANFHRFEDYSSLKFVGPPASERRPYGLTERIALTTSRVVGSPDPPPPFRVVRSYPQLKLDHPIMVEFEPTSQRFFGLAQTKQGAPTELVRFEDRSEVAEFETLHSLDGLAYDIAFHPQFAENGYLYVGFAGPLKAPKPEKMARVSRFTVDRKPPHRLVPDSETKIIEWQSDGHNGLALAFGPDGMLYVTAGDGTSDSDDDNVGQDMSTLLAKVLRIDVDHITETDRAAGRAYSVPSDNPFTKLPGARPETWAYGLRNPWRLAFDERTGHLWVTQNGQDLFEQVYFVRPGDNFGWSVTEGSAPFYTERKRGPTPIVPPAAEHPHSEARSLTGGVVYHGKKFSQLRGCYLYGDYSTGKIWAVRHDGKRVTYNEEIADTTLAITGFALDSQGELLVFDYRGDGEGGLYRLEPTPKNDAPSTFPRRLSESGLFAAGRGHEVVPGVVPYRVNSPLWSDGTYKERFFAVPGVEPIAYAPRKTWDFPEGTVLIKSFALETTAGDPKSRRWIETRFLTKQQNEWVGYSYEWNDEQTDAVLVEAKGRDREFAIRDAGASGGERKHLWHYPSRAECMVCHSRAANFVLGASTAQLNCENDYAGRRDNQLRTLAHIGLIKLDAATELRDAVTSAAANRGLSTKDADQYWASLRKASKQRTPASDSLPDLGVDLLPRLVDPADDTASLESRARSYLHANCAHCHVAAGGGNAQFDAAHWSTPAETRLFDARPVHSSFGLIDARLVAPGSPERSLLFHRMALRGRGQMPPVASALVDPVGVDVVRRWIRSLPAAQPSGETPANSKGD